MCIVIEALPYFYSPYGVQMYHLLLNIKNKYLVGFMPSHLTSRAQYSKAIETFHCSSPPRFHCQPTVCSEYDSNCHLFH